jgi:hypothetical protein
MRRAVWRSAITVARCSLECQGSVRRREQRWTSSSVGVLAQLVSEFLARGDDKRLEVVDRLRAGTGRAAPRRVISSTRTALRSPRAPAEQDARAQRFAAGADRVQLVELGSVAARRALRAVDLDHPLAVREQNIVSPAPKLPDDSIAHTRGVRA